MLLMAAVTSGAVWLRLATIAIQTLELPFEASYAIAAWASWGVPCAVAWALSGRRGRIMSGGTRPPPSSSR